MMIRLLLNRIDALLFISLVLVAECVSAVPGEILEDEIASTADPRVLMAEAEVFDSIRQGIALLLAQCEGSEVCEPSVSRDELVRIIHTLDTRIDDLSRRLDETGEKELKEIVDVYMDTHAEYSEFMDRLDIIMDANKSGDRRAEGSPSNKGLDLDIFRDADEDLSND